LIVIVSISEFLPVLKMNDRTTEAVKRIAEEIQIAGVRESGVGMVHASLRALGDIPGGAETVIKALRLALGDQGTLLMPALSYEIVTPERPEFDILHTPSNVGMLAEVFRKQSDTIRSFHPTHSVCGAGLLAKTILANHCRDNTPCGQYSPFRYLHEYNGQVLMLGCGLKPNTCMHAIEETINPPYLFGAPLIYRLINEKGEVFEKEYIQHGFRGWLQRYDRISGLLSDAGIRNAVVHTGIVQVIDAKMLWDVVTATMQRDPFYFVDQVSNT